MKRRRSSGSATTTTASVSAGRSHRAQSGFGKQGRILGSAAPNGDDRPTPSTASRLDGAKTGAGVDDEASVKANGVGNSDLSSKSPLTSLHEAAASGSVDALRAMLREGANANAPGPGGGGRTPLHLAALGPSAEAVQTLLVAGADRESRDADGRTPLLLACMAHQSADVSVPLCLVRGGAAAESADVQGITPLDVAVRSGRTEVVRAMLAVGTVPSPSPANMRLLYEAVRAGHAGVVAALVDGGWEMGPVVAAPCQGSSHGGCATCQYRSSPLMLAADSGRLDVVRALLRGKHKGFPDGRDVYGYTALHLATMRGSTGIAAALLGEARANPDVANGDGDTALHIAVATRRTDVGETLLRAGASVAIANCRGHTALHFAAALGLANFAKMLLDRGATASAVDGPASTAALVKAPSTAANVKRLAKPARLSSQDGATPSSPMRDVASGRQGSQSRRTARATRTEGRTPLHYAAASGRTEAAEVLLREGALPWHRWNDKRESPLFVAAKGGHAEVVRLLLERLGPEDVDMPASSGETPLHVACANGHVDVVRKLLRQGANVSLRDPLFQRSPLDFAVTSACSESRGRLVRALLQAGADPNAGGRGDHTPPLHTACRANGGSEALEAFLDAGADPDGLSCGSAGPLRPIHFAAFHGNADIVRTLTLRGCCLDAETTDASRSTALTLAVQEGHLDAARALVDAGARTDVVPRRADGSQCASSLVQLAGDMRHGNMISMLVQALVKRDCAETWTQEWAATVGMGGGISKRRAQEREVDVASSWLNSDAQASTGNIESTSVDFRGLHNVQSTRQADVDCTRSPLPAHFQAPQSARL